LLLTGPQAWAQVSTATFYGIVRDSTGATIPGASVNMTHGGTGVSITRSTDASGEFQFEFLRVGEYTLRIEAPGFKRYESRGLALAAAQNVRQAYTLEIGEVTETVTVEGTAPLLNAVAAEQRESLSTMEVTELPVPRRNFANLLNVSTGIQTSGGGVRMNGLGRSGLRVTVDGGDATQNVENPGTSSYQSFNYIDVMSIEAIQEVQVTKGVIAAEYAHQLSGNVNTAWPPARRF
jgi:hypothetical protein